MSNLLFVKDQALHMCRVTSWEFSRYLRLTITLILCTTHPNSGHPDCQARSQQMWIIFSLTFYSYLLPLISFPCLETGSHGVAQADHRYHDLTASPLCWDCREHHHSWILTFILNNHLSISLHHSDSQKTSSIASHGYPWEALLWTQSSTSYPGLQGWASACCSHGWKEVTSMH